MSDFFSVDILSAVSPHKTNSATSDEEVLHQLQRRFFSGDTAAFDALVTPHLDAIYTLCLRICGNQSEAEDLAQESLARALSRHDRYNPERPFRPWLLSIATNLCRDRLRTVWWKRVVPFSRPHQNESPSPEHTTAHTQRDHQVRAALTKLPLHYREALSLFYLKDMTYQEMSAITGTSVPALKQRVRRGRVMLREVFSDLYPATGSET